VPLGLVVLFSFNDGTTLSLPMEGLSLRWYQEFFANAVAVDALRLSLTVAVVVTLLTSLIGGLSAIGLARLPRSRSASLLVAFFLLPIAAPPLFLGLALLSMWDQSGIQLGFGTIVAAHLLVTVPIFALLSLSALGRVDPALSEAAHDLGASRVQAFRRVVLPQVWPAFAAAAAVTFAVSMDEFVVTVFNTGEQSTLPMYINGILRKTINPSINSISTLTILVTFVALGVGAIAARRATRRAQAPSDTEVVL
jgi:ABC-type spermidine/putrescine transport system permease subunit II